MVFEEQNFKEEFLELFFWNELSHLIRFKDADYSLSSSKGSTDSPWIDSAVEILEISPSDTSNQLLGGESC